MTIELTQELALRLFADRVKELDEADTKDFNELLQLYFVAPNDSEREAAYNGIKEIILIPDGKIVCFTEVERPKGR